MKRGRRNCQAAVFFASGPDLQERLFLARILLKDIQNTQTRKKFFQPLLHSLPQKTAACRGGLPFFRSLETPVRLLSGAHAGRFAGTLFPGQPAAPLLPSGCQKTEKPPGP